MKKLRLLLVLAITLSCNGLMATTYTSTGSGNFYNTATWTPALSLPDILSGSHDFIIANGHTVTLNDSVNVMNLTVNGTLTFGDGLGSHSLVVQGIFTVDGTANVSAHTASHKLYVYGGFVSNGTIAFRNNSNQVVNTNLNGAFSLTGTDLPVFNNLNIQGGIVTVGRTLDINGNLLVANGATFNAGAFTHTLAGSISRSGTLNHNNGKFVFDGTLVQSVSSTVTLFDVDMSGGAIVSLGASLTVENDINITNGTRVVTSASQYFEGEFTVDATSEFKANAGRVYFRGAAQTINMSGTVVFSQIDFAGSATKTINGSLNCNDDIYIRDGITVEDGVAGQTHYPEGVWIEGTGTADFNGTLVFNKSNSHYIRKSGGGTVSLGTADIVVEGALYLGTTADWATLEVTNDVTVNTTHLVINDGSQLVGSGAAKLTVKDNANLYIRGADNFPTGFADVVLERLSWVRYDANMNQTVRGGLDYGYLYTYLQTKTVDASLNIQSNLYIYATEADAAVLDLGAFDHYLQGSIIDNYDINRPLRRSYILASGGTFYLNGESVNQTVYCRSNEPQAYIFNNFVITNVNPTIVKTVTFNGYNYNVITNTQTNMIVTGDFTATNSTSNPSLPLELDMNTFIISTFEDGQNGGNGTQSGTFTIGDNVKIFTTGKESLQRSLQTFTNKTFHENSTVRFDGPEFQGMINITYGNIEFNGAGDKVPSMGGITVQGDIRRVGGSPVFRVISLMGVTHNFQGDWYLTTNEVSYSGSNITMNFNGANQQIRNATTFPNLTFGGSGTKTISGNLDVNGALTIQNNVVVNSSNYNIALSGNFNNNSSGQFVHTNALLTLDGTADQTISLQTTNGTTFESITIDKASGQVVAASDMTVNRNFYFTKNNGDFDLNEHTLAVGGNFYTQEGAELIWDAGAMVHFNGSSEDQLIRNYNGATIFPDVKFSGTGMKRLYEKAFDINGDFIMDNAAVRAEWFDIYVSGDWINNGGSFGHYNAVVFDGADQTIDATDFEDVIFAGTGTKYLNGHINLGGYLTIGETSTLDVSPDGGVTSYNITIEEHWNNNLYNVDSSSTGVFVPRSGTVTFVGEWSNIYTGDSIDADGVGIPGKAFYNLVINNASINYWTRLYPQEDVDDVDIKIPNDLKVENNFTLNSGLFYSYWNHVHVGGDFKNIGGNLNLNVHRSQAPVLYLEGTGIHEFDAGATHTVRRVEVTKGGTYNLLGDLTMVGNGYAELLVTNGKLDLNHNLLKINSNTGDLTIGVDGEIEIDSLAQLQMYSGRTITNNGIFKLEGTENGPAILSTISGTFSFVQNSGIFHAKYYTIENTNTNGILFNGGSIDGTNNFSNGRFSGGANTAYITLPDGGLTIDAPITIDEVVFNNGPTSNISRAAANTGAGIITFQNASGSLSGEDYDDDAGDLVNWTYPGSKFWDGEGADGLWHTAANWVGDVVPTEDDMVILDHTHVAAAYTVVVDADAVAQRISIGAGGNAIGLSLNGGECAIGGNVTINSGGTLAQVGATDTLFVAGSFSNSGTFSPNGSVVVFNPTGGTNSISNMQPFNDLIVAGTGGEVVLGSNIDVNGDITINSGELQSSNKTIYINGNWFVGAGVFDGGTGTVVFDRDDATSQTISGGRFNSVTIANASPKVLNDLIFLDGTMTINAGAFLDGGEHYIFIGDHWYNYEGVAGFTQTGNGAVIFNGTGTSDIGDYYPPVATESTTFNHLTLDGTGTKRIANSITINGNLTNRNGSNVYIGAGDYTATEVDGTAAGTFTMNGGTMYLLGTNSFPQGFGEYSLTGGTVDYYSDADQTIYGSADLEYYNLRIRRVNTYIDPGINGGDYTTKTANGNLFVSNQIWASDTCTVLDMGGHDLYLEGSLQLATQVNGYPPQIEWDGGSLFHEGAGISLDPDVILYNNIEKRGSGRMYLSVDVEVTGNVTIADDCSMDMRTFKMECTAADKTFTLGANTIFVSSVADTVPLTTTYAFPTAFDTYSVEETNRYYLNGNQNQAILPGVTYGTVYLNEDVTKTVTLHGDLDVNGSFYINANGITLNDNGFNLYLAGFDNDLRNYNPTSTITFDGAAAQRIYAGGAFDVVNLNDVVFNGGGGTTDMREPQYNIAGTLTIEANDTVYCNQNINFSGSTFTNNGVFNHAANRFVFNGEDQTINPGINDFYNVQFNNRGTKTFVTNGININNDMVIQGVFVDADPDYYDAVIVDFGALTHFIGSNKVVVNSTSSWLTENANIYFDRGGDQYIPAITVNNVTFANRGYKWLTGTLHANDIVVQSSVNFRSSEDRNDPNDIYCAGAWENNGTFVSWTNTVYFDAADTDSKNIKTNGDAFNNLVFNQTSTTARTYLMQDNIRVNEELIVGNGATLKTEGNNLELGNDDPNDGFYPDGEEHTIELGGTIHVDAGGGILFDQNDMYPALTVFGTLKVVGVSGNNATLGQLAGGTRRGTRVNIESGANVHFRFYNAEYLHYDGLVVKDGATLDPTNNFSDGIWNGIHEYASYTEINDPLTTRNQFIYLSLQNDFTGIGDINNVTFNHPRTPTVGNHFNVYRPLGATGTVTFAGTSGGAMAGETFEFDEDQTANGTPGLIVWPPVTQVTWDGSVSSDWFTATNWTPATVPDNTTDVIIPLITNGGDNPIIAVNGAVCKDLNITNGILAIESGIADFTVAGNFVMQSDAIFAISDNTVVSVTGDWDVASDAIFAAGQSEVDFVSSIGSTVINSRNAAFYDVRFSGGATFYLVGTTLQIDNDIFIDNGTLIPNTSNYTYYIGGDYQKTGGSFSVSPDVGFFEFNGNLEQHISGGRFSRLRINNQGATVFIDDSTSVDYFNTNVLNPAFEVKAGATFEASAKLYVYGNVDIEKNGTFNDGGLTHIFQGRNWSGEGDYVGTGTIRFVCNPQYFYRSHFNNIILENEGDANTWKYLIDTVFVTGNVDVDCYGLVLYEQHMINSDGSGVFAINDVLNDARVYVRGEDNYPSGFSSYTSVPNSYIIYDAFFDQTVRGEVDGADVQYGRLYLRNTSTKTLQGDIDIENILNLDVGEVVFDANNYNINLAGSWYNQNDGTFLPGNGEVIFDGPANQMVYMRSNGTNDFNKIIVDKSDPTTEVRVVYNDITITDKLWARSGGFYCYNNYVVTVMGDLIASDDGFFTNTGAYVMSNSISGGLSNLQFNGSEIRNLTINGAATFKALDDLAISNLFILTSGTFDGNGQDITIGLNSNVANISSLYKIGAGGSLKLGNRTTFNVLSGGEVEVIGASGAPATVTGRTAASYYYFNVENNAAISASNYIFQNMFDAGIYVKYGATIDPAYNFSDGSFLNPTSGGVCLRIENTQSFINNDSIVNVRFPNNPGNGTKNVAKLVTTTGILDFYSASGDLAGADFEDDNYNLINWPGVNTLTWKGGTFVSSENDRKDWNLAANWEPARVPGKTDNIVIPEDGDVTYFPVFNIDKVDGHSDTVRTVENNYRLVVDADHALGEVSLVVLEEFDNQNIIELTGAKSTLSLEGTFTNNGDFTTGSPSGGKLRFSGSLPSALNSQLLESWLTLEVEKEGALQISDNVTVNDVNVIDGKLQITNNTRILTVNSDFINKDEVDLAQAKLKLSGSGTHNFEPHTSPFYNVEIVSGTYQLQSPVLDVTYGMSVKSGATFSLNGNTFIYGSGSTSGSMVVEGMLDMNDDSQLQLRADADVTISGTFKAVGTKNHEAKITRNGSGRYSFVINGGNIGAGDYIFEYLDEEGLVINAGSTIDSLSNGKFSYGAAGGRYIDFRNSFGPADDSDTLLIENIQFDEGPAKNAKRLVSTDGVVEFKDAFGLTAGHYYEDDDGLMASGAIVWSYTTPTCFWIGAVDDNWDRPQNWNPESIPDANSIVHIQPGMPHYPVIDSEHLAAIAYAEKLTIYETATVTLADGKNLDVAEDITISGDLIVTSGSASTITVGASWANNGTFEHGSSSTVEFTSVGNMDINTGGQSFYNLTFNSGAGAGSAIFSTQSNLLVEGDLTIAAGTFNISNSAHKLYVSGDFVNNATFNHGNGEVILNGATAQSINNGLSDFYDITLSGAGAKTLVSNLTVQNDFESASVFNAGANTINFKGDLINNGTFNAQTSEARFNGTSSQFISKQVTLNNMVVNNTTALTAINLGKPVNVAGSLSLLDGIVETSSSNLVVLESGATLAASSETSYINGSLRKTGDADFVFPIGSGNKYAPLGISGMVASGTFTAAYYAAGYNSTQLGPDMNHVSDVEHWTLLRNSGTAEPLVTFYWNDGAYSGIDDIEPLVGAYYVSGTGWTNKGQSAFTGNATSGSITTDVVLTQFGYLTIGWEYIDLIWTGTSTTDWNTAANWSIAQLPSLTTNIVIPTGAPRFPVLAANGNTYDLNIQDGASLDVAAGYILNAAGNTTIDAGGVLNLIDNAELYLKGDFTNDGTINAGTGSTISVNGIAEQTLADITAYNLNIAGSLTKTLAGAIDVANNFTVSGALDLGASSVSIGGNLSLTGTIAASTGLVTFDGIAQQTISGNKQIPMYDVVFDNTFATAPQILLTTNMAVNNSLTLTDGIISIPDNSEELTIEVGATSDEGSANSFIDGYVRKIGITDFTFPTGDGERWARIGISDMGSGSGDFRARYFYEDYGVPTPVSGTIDHVSFTEYWDLSRPSGTATPKATLYWEDTASSAIDDPALLVVAHYRSGVWQDMGSSAHSWTGVGASPGYVTSNVNFSSFSPVTFGSTSEEFNPLPVELIDFEVQAIDNSEVLATWTTLSESNNSHFVLEHSTDGLMFEPVGQIDGAGNSNVAIHYSLTDKEPYLGVSYYRLRQVDFDGGESLSAVKSVLIDQNGKITDVVLFPNPVRDGACFIQLVGQQESSLTLMIVGSGGNTVVSESIYIENGTYEISSHIANLSSGLYTVILHNNTGNWVKKLFIE